MISYLPRYRVVSAIAGAALLLALTACGASEAPTEASPSVTASADSAPADSPSETESESPEVELDPSESFLAWLKASREPDAKAACALMTDELVERMLAEMAADGFSGFNTCEEMIEGTAAAYKLANSSAEVTIEVQEVTATEALLFVTYVDTGKCGTIVMAKRAGKWIMTEQVEECARG